MKKSGVLLVLAAGACVSPAAFGQLLNDTVQQAFPIDLSRIQGGDYLRSSYGDRLDQEVYNTGIGSETGGGFNTGGAVAVDDVTFGGPGATGDISINGIAFGLIVTTQPQAPDDHLFMRVTFYDTYNLTLQPAAGTFVNPGSGATVVWNLDLGTGWSTQGLPSGVVTYFPDPITFTGSALLTNAFIGADRTVGVQVELFNDAAFTTRAAAFYPTRRSNTSFIVGTSNVQSYFTAVHTPAAPVPVPAVDFGCSGGVISGGARRGTYLALQGTGYAPPRPSTRELVNATGCLADGTTSRSSSVATGGVKWYTMCISNDATDAFNQFLDVDTEGSATDVTIGVFGTDGTFLAIDSNDGSGNNAQLSFGMGRRAAVGDGSMYDGRDYVGAAAGIAAGEYDIAVAPADAQFTNGWGVNSTAAGGAFNINFNTNTNGTPIAAALPPVATDLNAGGDIVAPGVPIPTVATGPYAVNWYKVTTCHDASAAEPVIFDMLGTTAIGSTHAIFDANGNLLASASIGQGAAPDITFDGSSLSLPAGTYYVAQSYNGQDIPGTRWQFRSRSGDNGFPIGGTVNIFWADCAGGCAWQADGCYADYNNDGNGIDGDDVIAFFGDWDIGAACADVDAANGVDGDDVIAFFGAWDAGGVGYPGC